MRRRRLWSVLGRFRLRATGEVALYDKPMRVAAGIGVPPDDIAAGVDAVRVSRDRAGEINRDALAVADD